MNSSKTQQIIADILSAKDDEQSAIDDQEQQPQAQPVQQPVTSVAQEDIDAAIELATFARDKADSLLTEANLALENLSGKGKGSVLESKDSFHDLELRLEKMKRKLNVV
jgi:endonuclease III